MIDADNFKSINDLFGHDAGDEALTIIARSIRTILRAGDLVGRMGGEEFGVYLPDVDQRGAEAVAERIRRSVNLAVFAPDGQQRSLSVSIGGVACRLLRTVPHCRPAPLWRQADRPQPRYRSSRQRPPGHRPQAQRMKKGGA
jgi:diguanylate cyclase (GGDEF)-like protein